jgi:hypothetical protein
MIEKKRLHNRKSNFVLSLLNLFFHQLLLISGSIFFKSNHRIMQRKLDEYLEYSHRNKQTDFYFYRMTLRSVDGIKSVSYHSIRLFL